MASERSCSVTVFDHGVWSQYYSFGVILDGAGVAFSAVRTLC